MDVADAYRFVRLALQHPLARRSLPQVLARTARWQLAARLSDWPLVVPFASGSKLVVERGMTGATGNIYFGLHEFEDMAFVAHALRAGDLFVDVGANIGSYSVLAASAAGARVIACEPVPSTYAKLRRNVAINDLAARVRCEQVAISDHEGLVRMTDEHGAMNRVVSTGEGVEVPARTLDALLAGQTPAVIKIDVEGHEGEALAGAATVLASPALLAVVAELGGPRATEVRAVLGAAGLSPHRYDPTTRQLTASHEENPHNVLFVRTARAADVAERCRTAPAIDLGWTRV